VPLYIGVVVQQFFENASYWLKIAIFCDYGGLLTGLIHMHPIMAIKLALYRLFISTSGIFVA
jgi:hypothetical protein